MFEFLRHRSKSNANPLLLDPGNSAFVNRGVVCHHQAKARGNKAGIFDIDGGALGRDISNHALMTEPPDDT